MSSAAECGCDWSRGARAVVVVIPCRALSAAGTAGVGEKIDRLRAEAGRQARDWAKHGNAFEANEWETVAKWLGGIK